MGPLVIVAVRRYPKQYTCSTQQLCRSATEISGPKWHPPNKHVQVAQCLELLRWFYLQVVGIAIRAIVHGDKPVCSDTSAGSVALPRSLAPRKRCKRTRAVVAECRHRRQWRLLLLRERTRVHAGSNCSCGHASVPVGRSGGAPRRRRARVAHALHDEDVAVAALLRVRTPVHTAPQRQMRVHRRQVQLSICLLLQLLRYSGLFSGSLREIIMRLREALPATTRARGRLPQHL